MRCTVVSCKQAVKNVLGVFPYVKSVVNRPFQGWNSLEEKFLEYMR